MEDEVVRLCQELIRIDTSNPGDHSGPGERVAAEYVAERLAEVGVEAQVFESHPKRTSLVARIEGEDRSRDALLLHGHLDVVPARKEDWTRDPFGGEIADGCVWGRGAVDMKDMDAMILAVVRQRMREGRKPPRDVVLAFLADEEAGGSGGPVARPGASGAVRGVHGGRGGGRGFSLTVPGDRRMYLIETAEKGIAWMNLRASGTAGHGSMVHPDNAVTAVAEAVARLGRHEFPVQMTKTVRAFLERACMAYGVEFDPGSRRSASRRSGRSPG
ncbi:M20/M25/M40 family metallo-hydrolase [Actinomadura yumaensis]|uniref:M20/M25/M40 family metallo-hydrolase n=1 Tax=Actinomadura yumaensis TaxID=111807 RepID=UPI003612DAD7